VNIENLCQFNPTRFLKLFGLYVRQSRLNCNLTLEELALNTGFISPLLLAEIELGRYAINNAELSKLIEALFLNDSEILNLAKITQVQNLLEVSKELNEHFPR